MTNLCKTILVAIATLSIIGCGNYDYDVVIDHADKLAGNYYTTGGGRWLSEDMEDPTIYPGAFIKVEKDGMGITMTLFNDREIMETSSFTYNDLKEGMFKYNVGNIPMIRYNLNKGNTHISITIGQNNVFESTPTIEYESDIATFKGSRLDSNDLYNVAYLIPGNLFYVFFYYTVQIASSNFQSIVFEANVKTENLEAFDIAMIYQDSYGTSKRAWIEFDENTKTLYFKTTASKFVANANCHGMFSYFDNVKSINFGNCVCFDNATDMSEMFAGCSKLESIDLSSLNTENVTNISGLFTGCSALESIDLSSLNTKNITDMSFLFYSCSFKSLDLSYLNTENVTDISGMFYNCTTLESVTLPSFNKKLTDINAMFQNCESLETLDLSPLDTENVTDMNYTFSGCKKLKSLDLKSLNTGNVIYIYSLFNGCESLESLDLSTFNTINVIEMDGMFADCKSLKSLDLTSFNTENVDNMSAMFSGCSALESIDLSSFNTANVTAMSDMFYNIVTATIIFGNNFTPLEGQDMFLNTPKTGITIKTHGTSLWDPLKVAGASSDWTWIDLDAE